MVNQKKIYSLSIALSNSITKAFAIGIAMAAFQNAYTCSSIISQTNALAFKDLEANIR